VPTADSQARKSAAPPKQRTATRTRQTQVSGCGQPSRRRLEFDAELRQHPDRGPAQFLRSASARGRDPPEPHGRPCSTCLCPTCRASRCSTPFGSTTNGSRFRSWYLRVANSARRRSASCARRPRAWWSKACIRPSGCSMRPRCFCSRRYCAVRFPCCARRISSAASRSDSTARWRRPTPCWPRHIESSGRENQRARTARCLAASGHPADAPRGRSTG
jgi:hypothetical protein